MNLTKLIHAPVFNYCRKSQPFLLPLTTNQNPQEWLAWSGPTMITDSSVYLVSNVIEGIQYPVIVINLELADSVNSDYDS